MAIFVQVCIGYMKTQRVILEIHSEGSSIDFGLQSLKVSQPGKASVEEEISAQSLV